MLYNLRLTIRLSKPLKKLLEAKAWFLFNLIERKVMKARFRSFELKQTCLPELVVGGVLLYLIKRK